MPRLEISTVDATGDDYWHDDQPAERVVTCGRWQLTLRGAELAEVVYAGRPVLRSIRFVVRDHDWNTADDRVSEVLPVGDDALILNVRCGFDQQPVLRWQMFVGFAESRLRVRVTAAIVVAFRRNRLGLTMLHHPSLAGRPLEIVHSDESVTETEFPELIAPHQPARAVAGYRWHSGSIACSARFAGDGFEMEDQRNWTDASYKTYSTPLDLPFPVELAVGTQLEQRVDLQCSAAKGRPAGTRQPALIMPAAPSLPELQLAAGSGPGSLRPAQTSGMTVLVEIPADDACWRDVLAGAVVDAGGESLDVRIVAGRTSEIRPVIKELADREVRITRIGAYRRSSSQSDPQLVEELIGALDDHGLAVDLVAGTRAHFTELNRHIDEFADWTGCLTFSITPQMHDRSRTQLLESLSVQRIVAEQAVRLAGDRPVHIGPVTLRPRFNAVATTAFTPDVTETIEAGYGPERVPNATDPRQDSIGLAAWTLTSIAALAVPGVAALTFFEAWGPRGVRRPDGSLTPAGQVLEWIRTGGALLRSPELEPTQGSVGCIAQRRGSYSQLLVGNIGADHAVIKLDDRGIRLSDQLGAPSSITTGDDHSELMLPAYSTARLRPAAE